MIICTKNMDYRLGTQYQFVQNQVMVNSEKDRASLLCMKALANRGHLDMVSQQMASHPQYLESFLRTQHYILYMDGPLPLHYRHYIAIMAAARHHCRYLVSLHSAQFLRVGGDPLWLQGLEAAPPRLRHLDHINKVLAHQPWLTARSHIQALLKTGEQCWSLAELVQAVVLLAHCHSLCSFVFGSGSSLDSSCEVACLREQIQKSQEEIKERKGDQLHSQTLPHADVEEEDEAMFSADPSCFVTDPEFCYQEFARREEDHFQVFRVQDYSWEDHGFSLVNRLYSDIGHLLDERFRNVASLPFPHSPDLKRAIWNYIHCIYGIRYDDYDYGEVSRLLERGLKLYIKAVACYPDSSKTPLCPLSCAPVKASDKVHVNLLVMEARLQAELLYALRAITQYMIA
ncbi:sestrin-3-like [Sinocyclocheilus rhinocerous]|uniref:sestrin-3-like n=1 Tax=Sinocyclocheilus rhinocerous TaxID=307959 RepID=UPI0007B978E3|nr:PREDICTED: sestrin-3-like [Sinocyclocheilus rhinocerous]